MTKKGKTKGGIGVRTYRLLERCIEEGFSAGWHKAHDYEEKPDPSKIKEEVLRYIMLEVDQYFYFPELE